MAYATIHTNYGLQRLAQADGIGFLDYHLRQIADNIGYTVPLMPA